MIKSERAIHNKILVKTNLQTEMCLLLNLTASHFHMECNEAEKSKFAFLASELDFWSNYQFA